VSAPRVVCCDVGSVSRGNFAWCDDSGVAGDRPSSVAQHVASLLNRGAAVALGFECPLYVPLFADEMSLACARPGEGSRPWSAGAGCGALATGIVQVTWVLGEVRRQLAEPVAAHLMWETFAEAGHGLVLWEAFVSGASKGADHADDARLAALAMLAALPDPQSANAIACTSPVYSLAGAALLRTGWSFDLALLGQPCLTIKV